MEWGQAVLEARAARLRGQVHLSPIPLIQEPRRAGFVESHAQIDRFGDLIVSYEVREAWSTVDRENGGTSGPELPIDFSAPENCNLATSQ